MGEVIHVDFSSKRNTIVAEELGIPNELSFYLQELRDKGIEEDDIWCIIDAINDVNVYLESDPEIQQFASFWLQKLL